MVPPIYENPHMVSKHQLQVSWFHLVFQGPVARHSWKSKFQGLSPFTRSNPTSGEMMETDSKYRWTSSNHSESPCEFIAFLTNSRGSIRDPRRFASPSTSNKCSASSQRCALQKALTALLRQAASSWTWSPPKSGSIPFCWMNSCENQMKLFSKFCCLHADFLHALDMFLLLLVGCCPPFLCFVHSSLSCCEKANLFGRCKLHNEWFLSMNPKNLKCWGAFKSQSAVPNLPISPLFLSMFCRP